VGVAPADPTREIGDLVEYVLTPFDADERTVAETSLARAAEAAEVALREGIQPAMTKFNG
jgi:peptidyl-tRNA hydrolase